MNAVGKILRMLNQDPSSEVVPFVSTPVPYNMQQYGVQQPSGMQYYTPSSSPYIYSDGGGTMLPSDTGSKPYQVPGQQWQESGYVSGPGTYMPQQSGGPTGGGGQPPMRLSIQSGVPPPQQGPPQSQPTPTSTPPGAPVDMKPNSHIPGQTQLQQGPMYVQNQQTRAPTGSQNFHNSYQSARMTTPRLQRNAPVAMPSNNVPNIYQMSYGMMQPIPQTTIMMNVPQLPYPTATFPAQRHQGQNSNHNFYPANTPILVGHASQPYYPGGNYFPHMMRPQFVPTSAGTGPASQPGAPQGPIPTMANVQGGMVPTPQPPISSQESKKSRKFAIPIINPETGVDIFNDQPTSGNNNNVTPPRSNDSSARETPQPVSVPQSPSIHPLYNNDNLLHNFDVPNSKALYSEYSLSPNMQCNFNNTFNPNVSTSIIPFITAEQWMTYNGRNLSSHLSPTCAISTPSPWHQPAQFMSQSPPGFMVTPPPELVQSSPQINMDSSIGSPYSLVTPLFPMLINQAEGAIPSPPLPPLFPQNMYKNPYYSQRIVSDTSHYNGQDCKQDKALDINDNCNKLLHRCKFGPRPQNFRYGRRTNRGPRHR